jgi:hypothetical protein
MKGAANERARAEAERIAAATANQGGPPDAPPVVPPAAAAASPPPHVAGPVIIGQAKLAKILASVQQHQPQAAAAGAPLHERAGSTRLKAFSSMDAVEWMSWKTHYLEVCEINAWPKIRRVREAPNGNGREGGQTYSRHRPCLCCRPGRQPACPGHHLARPDRTCLARRAKSTSKR